MLVPAAAFPAAAWLVAAAAWLVAGAASEVEAVRSPVAASPPPVAVRVGAAYASIEWISQEYFLLTIERYVPRPVGLAAASEENEAEAPV